MKFFTVAWSLKNGQSLHTVCVVFVMCVVSATFVVSVLCLSCLCFLWSGKWFESKLERAQCGGQYHTESGSAAAASRSSCVHEQLLTTNCYSKSDSCECVPRYVVGTVWIGFDDGCSLCVWSTHYSLPLLSLLLRGSCTSQAWRWVPPSSCSSTIMRTPGQTSCLCNGLSKELWTRAHPSTLTLLFVPMFYYIQHTSVMYTSKV